MTVPSRTLRLVLLPLAVAGLFRFVSEEPVSAQPGGGAPVRVYSPADGLAHPSIHRIVRDSRGFLWFCTREGLSMYDGYAFTTYRIEDGLPSGHVTDILEAPAGIYWIATIEGLVRFDPAAPAHASAPDAGGRRRFSAVPAPGDSRTTYITRLARDESGRLWIGTANGVFWLDPARRPLQMHGVDLGVPDKLNDTSVRSLTVDRHGGLWIANNSGLLRRTVEGGVEPLAPRERVTTVYSLIEDRQGRFWAATSDGLWRLDLDDDGTPRLLRRLTTADGLPHDVVVDVLQMADGSLWVGTLAGAASSVGDDRASPRFTKRADAVGILEEDASGHLWIATAQGAVQLPRLAFTTFDERIGRGAVTALAETRGGEVAALTMRDGHTAVLCWDGTRVRAVKPGGVIGLPSWAWNQVLLHDSAGDWWIGTSEGVFRFSGAASCADLQGRQPSMRLDAASGLAANVAMRLFEDSRGDIWISTVGHGVTPDGLSRWQRRSGTTVRYSDRDGLPTFQRHYVSALAEDRAGNVWIGFSRDGGLARYRDGRFERFTSADGVPAGLIRDLKVDRAGRLWIASWRRGIVRVDDPSAPRPGFNGYTTADGLSSNETHGVAIDGDGRVYVASTHGVERLDPATGLIRRYPQANPLGINALICDRAGTLWFTSQTGMMRLDAQSERPGYAPRTFLTRLAINGEAQHLSAIGEAEVGSLTLQARRNSLQVGFVALGGDPGGLAYRYRLNDEPWSRYTAERTIHFANLAAGAYRLLVEARDSEGRVSERPATLAFTIVPPVWQRRSFIALVLLAAAAAAYGLHRYRLRQVLAITRIRDRIASDLHDDLGANLTKIAVLGEVARRQGPRGDGALSSIAGIARESIANMSDIIWAIDPERDTMEEIVRKMRQHASETFADGEATLTFRAPGSLNGRPVGIELRHDLFLLFKEAINNAARHASARRIDVDLAVDAHALHLEISDDGVGFDPQAASDGRGTGSMRRRAERLGGRLHISSTPGGGTTLALHLPLR